MTRFNRPLQCVAGTDLERVIEPLASYICATNRPQAALATAMAVLLREVEGTMNVAQAHVASFSTCRLSS